MKSNLLGKGLYVAYDGKEYRRWGGSDEDGKVSPSLDWFILFFPVHYFLLMSFSVYVGNLVSVTTTTPTVTVMERTKTRK